MRLWKRTGRELAALEQRVATIESEISEIAAAVNRVYRDLGDAILKFEASDAASHALGHSDLSTTLGIYGHQDDSDLETAMDRYASWLDHQDAPSVPPEDGGENG